MADTTSFLHSTRALTGSASRAESACDDLRVSAQTLQLTVPSAPICEDLFDAVERAADRSTQSMDQLRDAVSQFTAALKDDGAKPEAVLIALKSVINSRAFPLAKYYGIDTGGDVLRQQISTWSIEEFFREA